MKENISYVTGNYGKYVSVKEKFEKENILISYFEYNTMEPDVNDIKYVSKEKAKQAYDVLKSPVFVIDTGFYIENYPNNPGYPGALQIPPRGGLPLSCIQAWNDGSGNLQHCNLL